MTTNGDTVPDRINEIADRTARIEGKLDQYLVDQDRRCSAHDAAITSMNKRVDEMEDDIAAVRDSAVTKAFVSWAIGIMVVVVKVIDYISAGAFEGGG